VAGVSIGRSRSGIFSVCEGSIIGRQRGFSIRGIISSLGVIYRGSITQSLEGVPIKNVKVRHFGMLFSRYRYRLNGNYFCGTRDSFPGGKAARA
jgi:hypothetical protein